MQPRLILILGLFDNQFQATQAVEKLIEEDFPTLIDMESEAGSISRQ